MTTRSIRGFTAIEMIVVLAIVSILAAIALPPYLQWRRSLEARETARDFVNILRRAKSDAINTNREQEVQFDATPTPQRYGKWQGSQAYLATFPSITAMAWTNLKPNVTFTPSVNIQFYPNGTSSNNLASSATITVQDSAASRRIIISVSNTGYIRMR